MSERYTIGAVPDHLWRAIGQFSESTGDAAPQKPAPLRVVK